MKGITTKFKLLPLTVALASVLTPTIASAVDAPEDFKFTGYARYGAHISNDAYDHDNGGWKSTDSLIKIDQAITGNSAGRLGNEGNGGELQFTKGLKGPNDTIWNIGFMVDHWGDNIHVKKLYASATNVLESNPGATFWGGRDFHQRPQTNLADFFVMFHDGQGGGVKDLDVGFAKFDLGVVGAIADGGADGQYGNSVNDNGNYAVTTKLHDIGLGSVGTLDLYANYGFSTKITDTESSDRDIDTTAYQVAAIFKTNWSKGSNKFGFRYSDNSADSVFNKTEGQDELYLGLDGTFYATESFVVDYSAAIANRTLESDSSIDRTEYNVIVRPMYSWNNIHSTWLEFGATAADYDNGGQNAAWKATISQNMSINAFGLGRPMLRLYANIGEVENNQTQPDQGTVDVFAMGLMFESWW